MLKRAAVAAVLLAAALAGWMFLNRRDDLAGREERREARLLQYDDRRVKSFTLTQFGIDWKFARGAEGWRIVAPLDDAASGIAIEKMLQAARQAPVARTIDKPEALSAYGLDPPRVVVRVEGAPALALGEADPTRSGLFATVEGRPGVLVLGFPQAGGLLVVDVRQMRDPSITGVVRNEVTAIEIDAPSGAVRLAKAAEGWWMDVPDRLPASDVAVDRLLGALEAVAIDSFDDDADRSDPKLGLGAGAERIKLISPSATRVLTFGAALPGGLRSALRDDRRTLLRVDAKSLASAPLTPAALAETRLSKHNRYAVTRLAWRAEGGAPVEAVREGESTWKGTGGASLSGEAVLRFLVRVLEAPVSSWSRGTPQGKKVGSLEITLEGGTNDRLDFYANGTAAMSSLPGAVAHVTGTLAAPEF